MQSELKSWVVGFNYLSDQVFVVKSFPSVLPLGKKLPNASAVLLVQKHLRGSQRLADIMFCYEINNPYCQFIDGGIGLGLDLPLKVQLTCIKQD